MKRVLIALVAVSAMIAIAGDIESQYLEMDFRNHKLYKAIGGTDACTTLAKRIAIYPYQSINFNLYVSSNDGDSAAVVIAYQMTDVWDKSVHDTMPNKGHWSSTWTILDTFYGSPNDTLRYAAKRWTAYEYYPPVCPYIRFTAYGIAGNDSLTVIDSFSVSGYRD